MSRDRRQNGFTVVEIAIVVPILMVILIGLFSVLFMYLLSASREQARLTQEYSQTKSLDRLENDIRFSAAYLAKRDTANPDPYENFSSGSSWNIAGRDATHRVLILREFSTDGNPLADVRSPIYLIPSAGTPCTSDNITEPLMNNVIYFVAGTTLYRRTIVNTTSPRCGTQYQKLSCPDPTTNNLGTRDASCKADDEVIATDVTSFIVNYYADQTTSTAINVYNNPALLADAKSVGITIKNTSVAYGEKVTTQSSGRIISGNSQAGDIE